MATIIKEGMTGKKIIALKVNANRSNKDEIHSLSFCIKQVKKHGKEYLKAVKVSQKELTPVILLQYLTEKEKARVSKSNKYSFWLVESLVGRLAKAKAAGKKKEAPKAVKKTAKAA